MPRMTHPDLPASQEPFDAPESAVEHWQSLGWELLDDDPAPEFADFGVGSNDSPAKGDDDDSA